ncbi:MAG: response regulator [Bacteroidia bacterium]
MAMIVQNHVPRHNLIFIVEDDEMYSFMLEYSLSEEHKLRCLRFEKGEECINNLPLDPDMIILDYVLPGINGLETFRRIKSSKPDVPVMVLTSNFDSGAAQKFMDEGVYDYLLKEDDAMSRVKSAVVSIIEKKSREHEIKQEKDGMLGIARMVLLFLILFALLGTAFWLVIA